MKILMSIFTALYLVGFIIGHHLNAITDDTYYICIGQWAIMTILMQVPKEIKTNLLKIYLLIKIQEKNHIRIKVH